MSTRLTVNTIVHGHQKNLKKQHKINIINAKNDSWTSVEHVFLLPSEFNVVNI